MRSFLKRRIYLVVPAFLVLAGIVVKTSQFGFVEELQNIVFDGFQRMKPRHYDKNAKVRVLDLDDETLARLGQWPWPRVEVARLVDRLRQLGAKAIAFDVVFSEPDRTSPANALKKWPKSPEIQQILEHADRLPDHDRLFGEAVARGRVVVGFVLTLEDNTARPQSKIQFLYNGKSNPFQFLVDNRFSGALVDQPVIDRGAAGSGNFSFQPERDGVVRRVPMVFGLRDMLLPALSLEALRVASGSEKRCLLDVKEDTGFERIKVGNWVIPTDSEGRVWLYDSGWVPERSVPAWRIFEKGFNPALIRDNIVFIGTSAPGLMDLRTTPLMTAAAGVGVHAQITEQILSKTFLYRPSWALGAEVVFLILFSGILIYMLPRLGAVWCGAIGIGAVAGAFLASWYAFSIEGYLIDPILSSFTLLLVYLSSSLISFIRTEADKRQIRSAFGQYLSPHLVEQLAEHPEKLTLGGEMKEMTLLFTDIRGFTTISERFADNPHGLTQLINGFLTPMTDVILKSKGTVDKYMGDCIMAFWNAPLDDADHARNACRAALEMQRRLRELNTSWEEKVKKEGGTFVPIHTGVGINTGVVCVGNMGSEQRFDYSVLGDDVNLASRLEGQSKTYGVEIVAGENTQREASGLTFLELDLIRVKGKTKPVRIFSLLGDEALRGEEGFQKLSQTHGEMLAAYRDQEWADAVKLIAKASKLASALDGRVELEKLYKLYSERIKAFRADPPGKDWDGVFIATSK